MSWVTPSFGDFEAFSQTQPKKSTSRPAASKKRPRDGATTQCSQQSLARIHSAEAKHELWVDKYQPYTLMDLAVHKKKIEDVQGWIEDAFRTKCKRGCMLLLTGPPGVGKTASIRVLAEGLQFQIQEYSTPVSNGRYDKNRFNGFDPEWRPGDLAPVQQTMLAHFEDFILRANKYPTLEISGEQKSQSRKLILVEDFPNIFYRDVSPFHSILSCYSRLSHSPLVFIVSDSTSGSQSSGSVTAERQLFPKDLQADLNIASISFNPIAQTALVKVLQRIANTEIAYPPDKDTLEDLSASSNGDIRSAINSLQFTCQTDCSSQIVPAHKLARKPINSRKLSRTKSKAVDVGSASVGAKDSTLFLFRALGKILYCKRDATPSDSSHELPAHLHHNQRAPLLVNPEDVVERSHLSSDMFTAYLHQNYLHFYEEMEDVVKASEYVSDSDMLTLQWQTRDTQSQYASSVVTRGLMHSNTARLSSTDGGSAAKSGRGGPGWRPLHKPQWYTTRRTATSNWSSAVCLFQNNFWTPRTLITDYIPSMSAMQKRSKHYLTLNSGQSSVVRDLGHFQNISRQFSERLDEKDLADDDSNDVPDTPAYDVTENNTPSYDVTDNEQQTVDDITIEEFSD